MTNNPTAQDQKLVAWHTSAYNLISDESCIVCLTRQDVYLLGQALTQMRWRTRWQVSDGDTLPDINAIASELEYKLTNCIDFCQTIIDCIETTPQLQQLISSTALGSSIDADTGINSTIADSSVLIENVDCDNDNLFGMTTGLIDLYNNIALDIIEQLSASTNTMGRLGDAIEAIPGIGSLPVDDALQFTESFMDDIEQNYQAAYTVALADEYRCDLFCIAQENCELTFTQIFNYFNNRLITSIVFIDFQDIVEYLTNGFFAGEELVHAFHAFVAGVFMLGGDVIGIDSGKLTNMVSALFNDPNADWTILCTNCTWTSTWLNGSGSPVVDAWTITDGSHNVGTDEIDWVFNGSGSAIIVSEYVFTTDTTITEIDMIVRTLMTASSRFQTISIYDDLDVLQEQVSVLVDATPNVQTNTITLNGISTSVSNGWYITLACSATRTSGHPTGQSYMEKLTVTGIGSNPF
jgi:hypothetical protein